MIDTIPPSKIIRTLVVLLSVVQFSDAQMQSQTKLCAAVAADPPSGSQGVEQLLSQIRTRLGDTSTGSKVQLHVTAMVKPPNGELKSVSFLQEPKTGSVIIHDVRSDGLVTLNSGHTEKHRPQVITPASRYRVWILPNFMPSLRPSQDSRISVVNDLEESQKGNVVLQVIARHGLSGLTYSKITISQAAMLPVSYTSTRSDCNSATPDFTYTNFYSDYHVVSELMVPTTISHSIGNAEATEFRVSDIAVTPQEDAK
jgi:hypothetical protein